MQVAPSGKPPANCNPSRPEASISEVPASRAAPPDPDTPRNPVVLASRPWAAFAVLGIGLALSAAAAYWTAKQVQREVWLKFESAVEDARDTVDARIRAYSDVLLGARGLFIASETVSRGEFRDYIESLDLGRRYPGIEAVSYAQRIAAQQKQAFEAAVRNDTSVDPRGYRDFAIRPAGVRPEYVVVQYLEPIAGREAALGLDLAGDAVRLAALERARDSGRIVATGSIALALDPRNPRGFAMRLPVYRKGMPAATVAQRREAFAGVVAAVFIVIDLMRGVFNEPFLQTIHVRIHDAGFIDSPQRLPTAAENLMFDSDSLLPSPTARQTGVEGKVAGLSSVSSLEVGGRRWEVHFRARQEFVSFSDRWLPAAVMLTGTIISLLLFGLIRSLASVGARALALAASITEDLRRSEVRFRSLTDLSSDWYWEQDRELRLSFHSSGFNQRSGTTSEKLLGKCRWEEPNRFPLNGTWDEHRATLEAHQPFREFEYVRIGDDGEQHFASLSGVPIYDAVGQFAGYRGVGTNITQRKRAEEALRESEARFRSLTEMSSDFYWESDAAHRLTQRGAASKSGASTVFARATQIGERRWEVPSLSPDEAGWQAHRATLEAHLPFRDFEFSRLGDDGIERHLSISGDPVFDAAGAFKGYRGVGTDITERKRAQLRQAMEHRVTRLLSESDAPGDVMPEIIRTICEAFGFACGARLLLDEGARVMRTAEIWSVALPEVAAFIGAVHPPMRAESKGGLIRRVLASGEPVWIADAAAEAGFQRAPGAAKAGLHAACALPIAFGNEILGVMEFFSRAIRPPDEVLLQSLRSIGAQIGQFMARRQAEERVHHLAHYDELTGLPNRSMFNQRLGHALAQARRNDKPLAILFVDLDRFKNINDTLGHEAGDGVLKEVAQRLQGCLREGDTVGRLGGDEFVVLVEELPEPMHVAAVAQKILAAVIRPFTAGAHEFNLTASIGISTYPGDSEDMPGLLKNADIAMYRAKEQGKNNYQFYSALMNIHTVERLALESGLRRALERNEFLLHYQPKVDIGSGRITGTEALLRWQQPGQQALTPPALFIPLAEETGLIVAIGEWVLRTACAQNQSWREPGLPPLRVAVNLSARQFAHANLLQDVARALAETGLDPAGLELEITESMLMQDPERAVTLLRRLKDMGIHISIDDFGTGYSSLNYLKRFPLDSVKIDRSFIRDIPGDADDAAITRAIIAMAHSLRLKVIAEGVETDEQLDFLRAHGCDEMQGFHFSRALPGDEFLGLLKNGAMTHGI